ncbi:MAG: SAM hydrolase/SAM-dependent halogenase family protein [Thermodesulfobacteriota bacterium]
MGTPSYDTPSSIIALLTDFGLADPYLGQLKGVLMRQAPSSRLLDISHEVAPQQVEQAAFFLKASLPYLPENAVVLAVVDPGVGTQRAGLIARCEQQYLVAPDNGLLAPVLKEYTCSALWRMAAPTGVQSLTFQARDWFGPLAAALAQGGRPEQYGAPLAPSQIHTLPQRNKKHPFNPKEVSSRILHIDRFGNAILDLDFDAERGAQLLRAPQLTSPALPDTAIHPTTTYAGIPANTVGLLLGSQGYYELALDQASLAHRFNLRIGQELLLRPA